MEYINICVAFKEMFFYRVMLSVAGIASSSACVLDCACTKNLKFGFIYSYSVSLKRLNVD